MTIRSIISLAFSLIFCCSAMSQTGIRWEERHHNFGTFNEDLGKVTCKFTGINESKDTVYITDTRSTCGCTVPAVSSRNIAPGDTVTVDVTYDPDRRPGPFEKRITLVCADKGQEIFTISGKVKGSVRSLSVSYPVEGPHFRLQNAFVGVGNIVKGHTGSGNIFGINDQDMTITPYVEGLPDYVAAVCYPDSSLEGENFLINFTIDTSSPKAPYGLSVDSIRLGVREFPGETMAIPLSYIVSEDFSAMTREEKAKAPMLVLYESSIDFGRIDTRKGAKRLTRKLTLANAGESPLLIRRIHSFDKAVLIKIPSDKIAPKKSLDVTVEVLPELLRGADMLNARINIVTNSPAGSQESVRVVGEIFDSSSN